MINCLNSTQLKVNGVQRTVTLHATFMKIDTIKKKMKFLAWGPSQFA